MVTSNSDRYPSMLYSKYDVGPAGISRLVAYPKIVSHIPLAVQRQNPSPRGPFSRVEMASGATCFGQDQHWTVCAVRQAPWETRSN